MKKAMFETWTLLENGVEAVLISSTKDNEELFLYPFILFAPSDSMFLNLLFFPSRWTLLHRTWNHLNAKHLVPVPTTYWSLGMGAYFVVVA